MKVVLGSQNEDKINIVKNALEELHLDIEIKGVKVESEIVGQPLDSETTKLGSENRSRNSKKAKPDADMWFGLEGGLHDYGEGYHLVTYATLIDKEGDQFVGKGEEIHLPEEVSKQIKNGEWFGDVIREYAKDHEVDENLVSRMSPFTAAVQNAYASYLMAKGDMVYRKKASAIILNKENKILLVQLLNYGENDWNVPGGGIDDGETPDQAILRELKEELGTDKFEITEKSDIVNKYDFPVFFVVRALKEGRMLKGQQQTQFVVRFTGKNSDLSLQPEEIRQHIWVKYEELEDYLNFPGQLDNIQNVVLSSTLKEIAKISS